MRSVYGFKMAIFATNVHIRDRNFGNFLELNLYFLVALKIQGQSAYVSSVDFVLH